MKIRKGFVSNSSSSSFVIGIKDGELSEEKLLEVLNVPKDSPLFPLANQVAKFLFRRSELVDVDELLEAYGYDSLEKAAENNVEIAKLTVNGFEVSSCRADTDGDDGIEMALAQGDLLEDIQTENFVLIHQGY